MGKRTQVQSPQPAKHRKGVSNVPMPDALTALSSGRSSSSALESADDDLHIFVFLYADDASLYDKRFKKEKLWMVQLRCTKRPSPTYLLKSVIEKMGKEKHNDAGIPKTLDDLMHMYHAKYTWVDAKTRDDDDVGWKKGSSGFFVGGALKNFFMFFDELISWRCEFSDEDFDKITDPPKLMIHLFDNCDLSIDETDNMLCEFEIIDSGEKPKDISVYDMPPPCFPPRLVILTVTATSDQYGCLCWSGGTKPFSDGFNNLKIKRSQEVKNGNTEWYRVKHNVDFSNKTEVVTQLQDVLGSQCLSASPTIVKFRPQHFKPDLFVKALTELKSCRNVDVEL